MRGLLGDCKAAFLAMWEQQQVEKVHLPHYPHPLAQERLTKSSAVKRHERPISHNAYVDTHNCWYDIESVLPCLL